MTYAGTGLEESQRRLGGPVSGEYDISLSSAYFLTGGCIHNNCVRGDGNETINVCAQITVNIDKKKVGTQRKLGMQNNLDHGEFINKVEYSEKRSLCQTENPN